MPDKKKNKGESSHIVEVDPVVLNQNELSWTVHPVKRRPAVSIIVSLFITLVAVIVYYVTESAGFGLLALIVLAASISKFYMPTSYRLNDDEVAIKTVTQTIKKKWSLFRSLYPDKNGVLLSPFVEPSRLENFRGLYLIFGDNRDEVIHFIKQHISSDSIEEMNLQVDKD